MYAKICADAVDTPRSIVQVLGNIRRRATEEDILPLQVEQVLSSMRVTGNKKANGVDGLGGGDLARLPDPGIEAL
eukprot:2933010-Pyramimonas_sp.AAC.1